MEPTINEKTLIAACKTIKEKETIYCVLARLKAACDYLEAEETQVKTEDKKGLQIKDGTLHFEF